MSRGPGKWQRRLLDAVEAAGDRGVLAVSIDGTASQKVAQRRAARELAKAGRIKLGAYSGIDGHHRMVAYPPDVEVCTVEIMGVDGKTYRVDRGRGAAGRVLSNKGIADTMGVSVSTVIRDSKRST